MVEVVDGEEELLVPPLIMESPVGSAILYGQPPMIGDGSEGIVFITVTNSLREKIVKLLEKFDKIDE